MKLSVSLPEDDVAFLDAYMRSHGLDSRSGVLQEALAFLRVQELGVHYLAAWDEWASDDGSAAWDTVVADGIEPTAR